MAHQHHRRCTLRQELLQPLDRLDVEMVRGLVEQQHIRALQQNLSQLDAHAPTTRKLTRGTVEIATAEAQAQQRALQLSLIALATQHQVALVLLREPLHQRHILRALIVSALAQLAFHAVDASLQASGVAESLARLLTHCGLIRQAHHLRQITNCRVSWNGHRAGGRLLLTTQYLQERGLPRPILTHKGNAVAIVHHKAGTAEQRLHAKLNL